MTTVPDRVFKKPQQLTDDSRILGISAKAWDQALVGNMENELQAVKKAQASVTVRRNSETNPLPQD